MLDYETMGAGIPNPAITQLGYVIFDEDTFEVLHKDCYNISLEDSMRLGLEVTAGTVEFWMTHKSVTEDARKGMFDKTDQLTILEAHVRFIEVLSDFNVVNIYGYGARADCQWLESALKACDMDYVLEVFNYRTDMCLRSIVKFAKMLGWEDKTTRIGTYHNGLDDCLTQIEQLKSIRKYCEGEND